MKDSLSYSARLVETGNFLPKGKGIGFLDLKECAWIIKEF